MDADNLETRLARQRASVKWLLSKAFNNKVPDNLKEPFYKDHENQERLKPQIIVDLGNATLYCQTLSNIYSDPNYQSLNHWSILQTITRKGINICEAPEMPITETVLIQTNPLKVSAHIRVIESLMVLYSNEILSGDRVPSAIRRISGSNCNASSDQNCEQLLLAWISHSCAALKRRISQDIEAGAFENENGAKLQTPNIPPLRDFQDICDGVCLALLISYYCPKALPWKSVRVNYLPAVEDSIHNILLVNNFSQRHLPYSVFHMTPEDITYMRGSMKLNLMVMLADFFNLFEVHPAKCVCYPGKDSQGYVVHKSRAITTLSSVHTQHNQQQQDPLVPAFLRQTKEKTNVDTKAEERGDNLPAGRPSNWEHTKKQTYAGRRSRRNSSSEDSQLTIENFGGSQEHLNSNGRSFDRDRERKLCSTSFCGEPSVALRSSVIDARGTLQLGYDTDSGSEKQDRETEKFVLRHQGSNTSLPTHQYSFDKADSNNHEKLNQQSNTSRTYTTENSMLTNSVDQHVSKKIPLFVKNVKPYLQNTAYNHFDQIECYGEDCRTMLDVSKLSNIRMKLEEKRKRIEEDKLKIEMAMTCQQEKVYNTESQTVRTKDDMANISDAILFETLSNDSKCIANIDQDEVSKYQQSIFEMNSNLQELQQDIQKLVTQQSEIKAQQLQAHQLVQSQQISNMLSKHPYSSQQHIAGHFQQGLIQQQHNFGSTPHLPQSYNTGYSIHNSRPQSRDSYSQLLPPQSMQYINEHDQYINHKLQASQSVTQAQFYMPQHNPCSENGIPLQCNNLSYGGGSSNVPQCITDGYACYQYNPSHLQQFMGQQIENNEYVTPRTLARDSIIRKSHVYNLNESSVRSQPQRGSWIQSAKKQQNLHLQSLADVDAWQSDDNAHIMENIESRQDKVISPHVNALQASNDDIMTPQSICFIGDEEDVEEIERSIIKSLQSTRLTDYSNNDVLTHKHHNRLSSSSDEFVNEVANKINIKSGNLTYRIPSPSRPSLNVTSFMSPRNEDHIKEKGFYISFDDNLPKKPKPPLRSNRSPKKENDKEIKDKIISRRESLSQLHNQHISNESNQRNTFDGSLENNKATYNKYTDNSMQLKQLTESDNVISINNSTFNNSDRRHLEDVTNHQVTQSSTQHKYLSTTVQSHIGQRDKVLLVGSDITSLDHISIDEMERKKEKIILLSLQRRQQQEETKARKVIEANQRREHERKKDEERARKKEEQIARRVAILEKHRLKKAIEEAEREGKNFDRSEKSFKHQITNSTAPRLRQQKPVRPRPKTIHVDAGSAEISEASSISSRGKKQSNTNMTEPAAVRGRTFSRISIAKGSTLVFRGRKSNSLMNLCDTDSGLGRSTPPRRAPSPGGALTARQMHSPSGPGSLPPGLVTKRRGFDDGSSDISSTPNSVMEYSGPKLYKQPEAKSNRGIILNAVEYCVFPGAVNRDAKQKVLEKIARSEAKHFLVLFRDAGCQFRAMYSYAPEKGQVSKLYGTGPCQVDEVMFDKFFKYNSGAKCFSQVHTKHLTVTIDAFTIHNSLWQGKKVNLQGKKDLALVI